MTNMWTVFKYELRQKLRSKSYLLITFGVPLLAIVAFYGYRAYQDSRESKDEPARPFTEVNEQSMVIGYVDQTEARLFPAPDTYPPAVCQPTEDETVALLASDSSADVRQDLIKRISSATSTHSRRACRRWKMRRSKCYTSWRRTSPKPASYRCTRTASASRPHRMTTCSRTTCSAACWSTWGRTLTSCSICGCATPGTSSSIASPTAARPNKAMRIRISS